MPREDGDVFIVGGMGVEWGWNGRRVILWEGLVVVGLAMMVLQLVVYLGIGLGRSANAAWLTAVTGYMLVVGVIHYFFLRGLREIAGAERVADEFLHFVLPLCCLVYWVFGVEKGGLRWRSAFGWLGYVRALGNGGLILIGFWIVFMILILLGRKLPLSKKLPS